MCPTAFINWKIMFTKVKTKVGKKTQRWKLTAGQVWVSETVGVEGEAAPASTVSTQHCYLLRSKRKGEDFLHSWLLGSYFGLLSSCCNRFCFIMFTETGGGDLLGLRPFAVFLGRVWPFKLRAVKSLKINFSVLSALSVSERGIDPEHKRSDFYI